jgi:hypothetical protein
MFVINDNYDERKVAEARADRFIKELVDIIQHNYI